MQLDESFDENDEMDMSDDDVGPSSCKKARLEKRKRKVR